MFLKTGSDATTAALRIARRATGRTRVARCGYHGWHDWCLPKEPGVLAGLDEQEPEYSAREPTTLQAIVDAHPGELAAVILAPEMIHPLDRDTFQALIDITHRAGAIFILDEIKTGVRTRPGTVQELLGIRPDLTTISKAMGNGWPIAAVLGPRAIMEHASGMHLSATYHGDTAPMAAALATLAIVDREGVRDHVWSLGERLLTGLAETAARHRVPVRAYGEPTPAMPFVAFTHDDPATNARIKDAFFGAMHERGFLLHPRHLWFISASHRAADIDRTIEASDAAFALAAQQQ